MLLIIEIICVALGVLGVLFIILGMEMFDGVVLILGLILVVVGIIGAHSLFSESSEEDIHLKSERRCERLHVNPQ